MASHSLTDNQLAFLVARTRLDTDDAAAKEIGISPTRISRWKQDNPEFLLEYDRLTKQKNLVLLGSVDERAVALRVLQKLEPHAEDVTQALLDMIQKSGSGAAKIQAIRLAYEILGVVGGDRRPEIGPNLQKAIAALVPVYKAQIESGATPPEEVIDVIPMEVVDDED